jgi:hypothetical protein
LLQRPHDAGDDDSAALWPSLAHPAKWLIKVFEGETEEAQRARDIAPHRELVSVEERVAC